LTNDVKKNAIVVLGDGSVSNKLTDNRWITIDLILQERIEILVIGVVWHDDKEDKLGMLDSSSW